MTDQEELEEVSEVQVQEGYKDDEILQQFQSEDEGTIVLSSDSEMEEQHYVDIIGSDSNGEEDEEGGQGQIGDLVTFHAVGMYSQGIKFKIDSDEVEFSKLINSSVTGNDITFNSSQLENSVEVMELTDDLSFRETNPGVGIASFFHHEKTTTGYIYIAPKTLKPMSVSKNVRIMLWVLQGEVTVRPTDFEIGEGNKINYLCGKTLSCGSFIMVPPFTPYMLENRNDNYQAVLGYVMISS